MKTKLVVTSTCSYAYSRLPKTGVVTSLFGRWSYDYRPYVDPLWYGFISKVKYFAHYVKSLVGEATHIMLIDSADVVPLCGPDELMERWRAFGHPWVYNAEPNIWPIGSYRPEDYPTPVGAYDRYLNTGACIGEVEHVAKWYDLWTQTPVVNDRDDQHWTAGRYLKYYPEAIKLDTNCDLFQCMCANDWNVTITPGLAHNTMTNTHPVIIHFNGGTDITAPERRGLWEGLL